MLVILLVLLHVIKLAFLYIISPVLMHIIPQSLYGLVFLLTNVVIFEPFYVSLVFRMILILQNVLAEVKKKCCILVQNMLFDELEVLKKLKFIEFLVKI